MRPDAVAARPSGGAKILPPRFFEAPAADIARGLLGKALVRRRPAQTEAYIITETEAYLGPHDLACHSARGRTPRTEVMFAPPGTLYVYLIASRLSRSPTVVRFWDKTARKKRARGRHI